MVPTEGIEQEVCMDRKNVYVIEKPLSLSEPTVDTSWNHIAMKHFHTSQIKRIHQYT